MVEEFIKDTKTEKEDVAKFNASMIFNEHLVTLIALADTYASQEMLHAWNGILECLYRDIGAYMGKDEIKKARDMYIELRNSGNEYIQYIHNWKVNLDARRGMTYPWNPPNNYPAMLHDFDMFLKGVMKNKSLLTPIRQKEHSGDKI